MEVNLRLRDGSVYSVKLTGDARSGITAQIGERVYRVNSIASANGRIQLAINGRSVIARVVRSGNLNHIAIDGRVTVAEKAAANKKASSGSHGDGDLIAAMPGQIVQMLVGQGDVVRKGQTLLILEAMKMETRIKAPYDGIVAAILCQTGAVVERGAQLITLEHAESAQE